MVFFDYMRNEWYAFYYEETKKTCVFLNVFWYNHKQEAKKKWKEIRAALDDTLAPIQEIPSGLHYADNVTSTVFELG